MPKKRVKKHRGSGSCGGGSRKNRRGRGNRGGSGRAGAFKHEYLKTIKSGYEIGKYGFTRPEVVKEEYKYLKNFNKTLRALRDEGKIDAELYEYLNSKHEINVGDLEVLIEKLGQFVSEEGNVYTIDLTKLGYKKLLGSGSVSKAINVRIEKATQKAITKIEEAGGKILMVEE
jgi:large subunit ribosomal protein L15